MIGALHVARLGHTTPRSPLAFKRLTAIGACNLNCMVIITMQFIFQSPCRDPLPCNKYSWTCLPLAESQFQSPCREKRLCNTTASLNLSSSRLSFNRRSATRCGGTSYTSVGSQGCHGSFNRWCATSGCGTGRRADLPGALAFLSIAGARRGAVEPNGQGTFWRNVSDSFQSPERDEGQWNSTWRKL